MNTEDLLQRLDLGEDQDVKFKLAEGVEDLEAALEQFRFIAGDPNGGGAATT